MASMLPGLGPAYGTPVNPAVIRFLVTSARAYQVNASRAARIQPGHRWLVDHGLLSASEQASG